ncbi:hypothetical protein [Jiella avicenniae]|uniref:Uncharacterized protein n=1 Tax=Jiella avicenniae TaxID=2907202 RepID=A0A9X1NWY8_9HYPH|nr:hypothetical protein [Jiella avicenniae]MCE7026438.1 hypothetical protein [Jiella avicenniae]
MGIQFKVLVAALLAVGIGIAGAWVANTLKKEGRNEERARISDRSRQAGDAGEDARLSRRECVAGGMRYEFATGRCLGGE